MTRDDLFAADVAWRLRRIERELQAAVLDAQCRDWVAERPDRVVFARLGEACQEVRTAAGRYRRPERAASVVLAAAISMSLLLLTSSAALWPTVAAALAGPVAVGSLSWAARRIGGPRVLPGGAAADDPQFYAGLRRRIQACAAAARVDRSYRRRAAATDLDHALDRLAAAQAELPRRY